MKHILCVLGIHDWDGHTDEEYPAPRCKRCGKKYRSRNVVQQNIVAGGDVCAGDIVHTKPTPQPQISEEKWKERFIHVAAKLGVVLGLNNQERQWVREAGIDCPDEPK